jgi:exosortase J
MCLPESEDGNRSSELQGFCSGNVAATMSWRRGSVVRIGSMSTSSTAAVPPDALPAGRRLAGATAAMLAGGLGFAGVFSILPSALALWLLWTNDPLKSIGGLIFLASLVLIVRVWRSLGWVMHGSWWGLGILAATIALVHLRDRAILELILTPSWTIFSPPVSLVMVAYTAGVVLLFGGPRLLRAALFPIVLMWFVNPVPNFFTLHIDLPLQHASSLIARGFAQALGQRLTSDQLRLMFTPDFGMFIAPGCDGIRGSITMGFIALIAGYLYRFRLRAHMLVVVGAVLLGYVFNLVRLCVLVLYYIVALHIKWLQSRAEMGDYLIGACLFFIATALLFTLIRRFSPGHDLRLPRLATSPESAAGVVPGSFLPRWIALALLLLAGSITYARGIVQDRKTSRLAGDPKALGLFPQHVGHYKLQREWNEYMLNGPLVYYWADYAPDANSTSPEKKAVVSVGVSPVLGAHDTLLCHSARGEDWLWHGDLLLPTAKDVTSFSLLFFNNGATQYLEATTVCTGTGCGQYSNGLKHFGFVYSRPDTRTLLSQSPTRPIPILLRTATLDTALAPDIARAELTANLQDFLSGADLPEFTRSYRQP